MNKPLVSIIMPTFNRANLISRALNSCINQTYQNLEIIVVDDNPPFSVSRKETEDILKNYLNHCKVRYIKLKQNVGASEARNVGIKKSKGKYITFLDDDDEYLPENIEKEVEFITKFDYDVIFCDIILYDEKNNKKTTKKYKKNFTLNKKSLLRKHLVDIISGGIAFMYKRQVLVELGGFPDIPANQEYMLMLNTIAKDYNIGYFEYAGAIAYRNEDNEGITGSIPALKAKKTVLKQVKPYLQFLKFNDRRKVVFRLNLFIVIQSIRLKQKGWLKHLVILLLFLDLLILKILTSKNNRNVK